MLNREELNTVNDLLDYLSTYVAPKDLDIDFDVTIGDANGDVLGRIARVAGGDYQFLAPGEEA